MKRIGIATDGSESANRALEEGANWAKQFDAELILINVEQGFPSSLGQEDNAPEKTGIDEVLYGNSIKILGDAAAKAAAMGVSKTRSFSGLGEPVSFILEVLQKELPDMVVVGRNGRGPISGLILGSVSQKLAASAPCKVLIVP